LPFRGCKRFVKGESRGSQEKEELTGPEQDVQKAAAIEISKFRGVETDVERLTGALFDESSHGSQVYGVRTEAAAPRIQALEVLIAREQEMLQAEIPLIQGCNCGATARLFGAISFAKHCPYRPPSPALKLGVRPC
jgi:hypothetical protein